MAINQDFRGRFCELNAGSVRYLVVGGHAVAFDGRPRYTKDIDVWVDPAPESAARAWKALAAFGAPLGEVRVEDVARPGMILMIGVAPDRIDVLTHVDGLEFAAAWARRVRGRYADCDVEFLS